MILNDKQCKEIEKSIDNIETILNKLPQYRIQKENTGKLCELMQRKVDRIKNEIMKG